MKELKFKDTIQFGIWKFLVNVEGAIKPHFACAQPIPIGVRIGEDHQTITEVGVCGLNLPGISCAGATSTVLMHRAILIDQNESTVIPEGENFIINGGVADQPPEYLEINPTLLPSFPPPTGYNWVESMEIKNNSNQDVRFEHQFIPDNQNQIRVVLSGNPTVISFNANRSGVCLSVETGPIISCVGATKDITIAMFSLLGEISISVNGIEREFISSGESIAFTAWFNNEFGHLVTCYWGDFAQFDIAEGSLNSVRISIKSNSFIENIPYQLFNNPTFGVEGDTLYFCLDTNINVCVALPPANFNFDKTLYKIDKNKNYFLYYKGVDDAVQEIEINSSMNLDNNVGVFSIQDFPRLSGFIVDCTSETELYPETCNTFVYEGIYYVNQRVQTWYDHHYVGSFYVDVNGVRTYLQNSSKNFPHNGASVTLKEVLEPYYKDVAAFLVSFGVDAVYDPNFWGSYNSGGIKVIRTSNQYETIKFGSEAGYDLMFDGFSDPNCISFKTFEELENGPSNLSIQPISEGNPGKSEYTLLGTYNPPDDNEINILRFLGITKDINLSSCYEDMPS